MHAYALSLKKLYQQNANPEQASPMKHYMRGQFEYLGIKTPQSAALLKDFTKENGLPPLDKLEKKYEPEFITTIEYLIITKPWWDTVDALASHAVGIQFKRFPDMREKYLRKWRKSDNFWLRRTTLLFQLGYKKETDFDLLCEIIQENLGSDEFFINKAIGWALRQYAWSDPKTVKKFVNATKELHPLSRREALKNIGG